MFSVFGNDDTLCTVDVTMANLTLAFSLPVRGLLSIETDFAIGAGMFTTILSVSTSCQCHEQETVDVATILEANTMRNLGSSSDTTLV
jgi:hypothetical protein